MVETAKIRYLDFIPNVLRESDLKHVPIDQAIAGELPQILTDDLILQNYEAISPRPILLPQYPDFNALLKDREKVRRLELLPVKSPEIYQWYHSQPVDQLADRVKGYLGSERLALAPNIFPYQLPADLRQLLLWVGEDQIEKNDIVNFCSRAMTVYGLNTNDVVLFERSQKATAKLLRGTFKEYRHIHFWMRDKALGVI